jgi:hypothetical protein
MIFESTIILGMDMCVLQCREGRRRRVSKACPDVLDRCYTVTVMMSQSKGYGVIESHSCCHARAPRWLTPICRSKPEVAQCWRVIVIVSERKVVVSQSNDYGVKE